MRIPPYFVIHKKRGQTPLEALEAWRKDNPSLAHLPATYAGRLDPMAEGKLLLLLGDECKKREKYLGLDKEYVVEVALGSSTDTGDLLGLPVLGTQVSVDESRLRKILRSFVGSEELPYPAFSSKTVSGKPLFQYALEGTLNTVSIPTHAERIYRLELLDTRTLSADAFSARVAEDLSLVPRTGDPAKRLGADFRQDAVRAAWQGALEEKREWPIVRIRVTCASGTYMRTLATRIGEALNSRAFALSITRTRLGRYRTLGPLGWWSQEY